MLSNLGQIAGVAATKFGEKEALVFENQTFSYNKINEMVERLASGLAEAGVRPGDIVTLYAGNDWRWIISYYGIARAGGILNPVNTMLTPDELSYVVEDCGAKAIIASEDLIEGARAVLDKVKSAFIFGDTPPTGMGSFDSLLENNAKTLPEIDIDPESISTICYTSGTTGHPKGAMQSHRSVIMNGAMTSQMHMRGSEDVVVSALPCPHVYANVIMQSMMLYGCKLILHKRFDAKQMLADIELHKATLMDGVPTMYMYMLNEPSFKDRDLSSLTRAFVGGQTMPIATMEAVESGFGIPLIELWGMTEIAGLGTTHPVYGPNKHGSIGCALPYHTLRISDAEDPNKILEVGEVGELQIKGPLTMMGYYNAPEKTADTLLADGWLRTGDLAKMDADGCVYIVDRLKDMILTGGFNVYPAEIERVLAAHPAISMAAVGRKPDELKGEIAKAYIVLKDGANVTEVDINAFCRAQLSAYKCPRAIQFVDDFPKTSSGKIMRRELHTLDDT